jgi:esterase/lipase superfamily enzyme
VLFTWASRGKLAQYVYDMNSATAARDNLEHTIRLIFASDADQVNLLAHSMGNWVTVETLRQIKISGHLPPMQKLGMVMLAAPDIDLDVFKSQMRTFGKVKKPFYVILAKNDRALWASSILAGGGNACRRRCGRRRTCGAGSGRNRFDRCQRLERDQS